MEERLVSATAVTQGPGQHYFGYYDKNQFDASDRYLLGLECDVMGRLQQPDDSATIGIVDLEQGNEWIPVAESAAWNWQMGCMAEWLPGTDRTIIYNDRREGAFVSVITDIERGEQRVLPHPVFEIAPDGRSALTLNFSRLWNVRPETGYCGVEDPWDDLPEPDEDGIFRLDLDTGETTLVISHLDMAEFQPAAQMPGDGKRYFTHLNFNEDGSRFMFWYRCAAINTRRQSYHSGIYTASADGRDMYLLNDNNSHSTWFDSKRVLAWATHKGNGRHTYLFADQTSDFEIVGKGVLEFNGHATFSPNRQWLLTDMAPDEESKRAVVLYSCAANCCVALGRFHSMPELAGALRCDLHPRWSRDGTRICIDSVHGGSRQMYLCDVTETVSESDPIDIAERGRTR